MGYRELSQGGGQMGIYKRPKILSLGKKCKSNGKIFELEKS